jgi:thiol-disulfide isomerase/thioredoxin
MEWFEVQKMNQSKFFILKRSYFTQTKPIRYFVLILILIFTSFCKTEKESNLNVNQFSGRMLDGTDLRFSEIINHRIALNVYSHTCIPCFKEIPTLNFLRNEMKTKKLGEFYMVVEPYSLLDEDESISFDEVYLKAKEIMEKEIQDRGIELPVVIMKPPFKIEPSTGLVTGTPESLLFKTSPLTLYYNFIGSISEETDSKLIQSNPKVQFFLRMVQQ